jgi:hypothetical protein
MSQPGPFGPPPPSFQAPPFQPKPVASPMAGPTGGGPTQMEYLRSFNYIFENPNWIMNLIWGFLASLASQIIPVLPQLVFMGYQYEVIEELYLTRGTRYPDFDINRFADYLGRSIWPFLVTLIVMLIALPIVMGVGGAVLFGSAAAGAAGGEDAGPFVFLIGLFVSLVVMIVLFSLVSIVTTPMILRAGLSQDFASAFDFGWIQDFAGKMWLETLLSVMFLFFSIFGIIMVTCGLAAIVLGPMMPFVSSHLWYQLYAIYLARGGTPIPLKPRYPVAPQSYMPPPGGFQPPPRQF